MLILTSPSLVSELSRQDTHKIVPLPPKKIISFFRASQLPPILLLDLKDPGWINVLTGFREFFDSHTLSIYGVLKEADPQGHNLFLALGGDRFLTKGEEVFNIKEPERTAAEERKLQSVLPVNIDLSERETNHRLLINLEKLSVGKDICAIPQETEILSKTIGLLLEKLREITQIHLAVILLHRNHGVDSYISPAPGIVREDYEDFLGFCLNDFFQIFKGADMENPEETLLGDKKEFEQVKGRSQKISSYYYLPLVDSEGTPVGSVHLGHLNNNYFKGALLEEIGEYVKKMENPLLYSLNSTSNSIRQEKIFNIFSKFVPPHIIPDLIEQEREQSLRDVEKREITILFSDIRSFTTITENNRPQDVVEFLNRHFDTMVEKVKKYGGTIDKFIGDAIVAIFGLSDDEGDPTLCAVQAAREMIQSVSRVDCSGLVLAEEHYRIGIGVHRGDAIIGNIGSTAKRAFTAIGDVIGIAEELEGITKVYKKNILFTGPVAQAVSPTIPLQIVLKKGTDEEWPQGLYSPKED
jgi:class 3 adenylate cyclase